ncbi:MAG: biopolymer transporter ExbD [Nitrospirae bacterium]|nr:biopolymer transporter ExbD [Nitrospirota bacterium]
MEFERKKHSHDFINIAPLVDVVFLLLLFFMLSSHLVKEPAITIRLPESKTAEAKNETVKTILITSGGEIYFLDKNVELRDLQGVIKDNLSDIEKDFLRIKADRDVNVGLLVSVIDEVRFSGVTNFSIVTEKG